jgi:hypothetical protein
MRYLVIAGLVISTVLALSPMGSFRYQSTAFLWEDDYDLLFDPARIPLIQGSRIYTNLSNFISNQEEHFSQRSEDYLLIGGSTDLLVIYPGFVYDKYCSKEALPTGLFSQYEYDTLFGDAKTVATEWLDLDNNGSYDHRVTHVNERQAWDDLTDVDYYIGLGYKSNDLRLGLSFFNHNSSNTYTNPYYNSIYDRRDSSLISGNLTYTVNDTLAGPDNYEMDSKRFMVSGWYDFEQFSVGLMAGFNPISRDSNYIHTGSSFENRSPSNPNIQDFFKSTMVDTLRKPWSGTIIPIGLTVFAYPRDNMESRFYLNFFMRQEKLGSDASSFRYTTMDSTGQPGMANSESMNWHMYRGGLSSTGINFRTTQLFTVTDRFDLGFGLEFGAWNWEDTLADTMASFEVYEYNNGDTISGPEDFRMTMTSSEEWLKKVTGGKKVFSLPVGFDFRLTPSISLRLGAIHSVTWTDITTTGLLRAFEPILTRYEYGDSTFSEMVGPQSEVQATSETINNIDHNTTFTYGIGFNPIKNLQIDIMGFRNLTNLTNWKLSITFKF